MREFELWTIMGNSVRDLLLGNICEWGQYSGNPVNIPAVESLIHLVHMKRQE